MKPTALLRIVIVILSALGLWGAGGISIAHWSQTMACPSIGVIPACYVVLLGYGLILLSIYPSLRFSLAIFLMGWLPVMTLASFGVIGELTSTLQCPHTAAGIPKCYFSAAMALLIGLLYWPLYRRR